MMKKIIILISIICFGLISKAQYPGGLQSIGNDSNVVYAKGGLKGRMIIWPYADTAAANLERIRQYTGSNGVGMIYSIADSSLYFRFNNAWIRLGSAGGGATGSFWSLTGNYLTTIPAGYGLGTNSNDALWFKTNNTTRMVLPETGLSRQVTTGRFKYLVWDTTALTLGYSDGGSGTTPTWQQTLTAGSTLTGDNTIAGGGFNWSHGGIAQYLIGAGSGSSKSSSILADSNFIELNSAYNNLASHSSAIRIYQDSVKLYPHSGRLIVDSLNYTLSTAGKKLMVRDTVLGLVQNIDPSLLLSAADTLPYPKWSIVQDAGGTTYKSQPFRIYNVKDYGATGDSSQNATSYVQAAINACMDGGGGMVYFPNGIYDIDDSLRTTSIPGTPNSQLYIPLSPYSGSTDTLKTIMLVGETAPNNFSDAAVNKKQPLTGAVIRSGLRHTGAILGLSSETVSWGDFNFVNLIIKNINFKSLTDSSGVVVANKSTAIDASKAAMIDFEDVKCDVTSNVFSSVTPLSTAYGIKTPAINNFATVLLKDISVQGYYTAISINEHTTIEGANLIDACYNGIEFLAGYHTAHIDRICIARCKYDLLFSGVIPFEIDNLAVEYKTNDLTPVGAWFNTTTVLQETVAGSVGKINYSIVKSGVGIDNTLFNRTNATTSKINAKPLNKTFETWTTATRRSAEVGVLAWNSTTNFPEYYDSNVTAWKGFGMAGTVDGVIQYNVGGMPTANSALKFNETALFAPQVLIGAASSSFLLDIQASINDYKFINLTNSNAGGSAQAVYGTSNGTSTANYGITGTGYTTYGSLVANSAYLYTPSAVGLHLMADNASGIIKFSTGGNTLMAQLSAAGAWRWTAYGAGTITSDASGNLTSVSDERLKYIQGRYRVGLKEVMNIQPILYKWRPESGMETEHIYPGFSAQNVLSALGEQATGVNSKGELSIQDRAIMASLVNAIQEQQKQIEELKIEIKKLKHK